MNLETLRFQTSKIKMKYKANTYSFIFTEKCIFTNCIRSIFMSLKKKIDSKCFPVWFENAQCNQTRVPWTVIVEPPL